MKNILVTLLCLFIRETDLLSQPSSIDSIKIFPLTPHPGDTVWMIAYIETANSASLYDQTLTISDSVVIVTACYLNGLDFWDHQYKDTLVLGEFNAGNYLLKYTVRDPIYNEVDSPEQCRTLPYGDSTYRHFTVSDVSSVEPVVTNDFFRLYPNPTSEKLSITFNEEPQHVSLQICSTDGRVVMQQAVRTVANRLEVDVSALPPGMYFLALQDEQHRYVNRFVKE